MFTRQVLSFVAAAAVALATLLPADTSRQVSLIADGRQFGDDLGAVLPYLMVGLAILAVIGMAWKGRLAKRLRMSWPLFAIALVYLLALAVLVSTAARGAVFGMVATSTGEWLRDLASWLDSEHLVTYVGFTILVALAWREKIAWPWLGLGLFGFGFGLELLQELVPGRNFEWNDVASNGLGVLFGLIGLGLFDLLADARTKPSAPVPEERRRRRSSRSSRAMARPSRGPSRSGVVIVLAGLAIAVASLLVGSVTEFQIANVGRQLLAPFSALYALAFWVGALVTIIGVLVARSPARGRRYRTAWPR